MENHEKINPTYNCNGIQPLFSFLSGKRKS